MSGDGTDDALSPLYHACMADDRALVKKLLLEGANPNDGESVYHAAQLYRRECLELLLAHGADLSSRNATYGNTPLYFLAGHRESDRNAATVVEGMRWLLEHGADPNVTSDDLNETPLQCLARNGWGPTIAELFAAHGADLDLRRADGRSAYTLAVRSGNSAMAEWLRRRGADTSGVTAIDELLGACMRADEPKARAILFASPGLIQKLTKEDGGTIVQAVYERREASVRLMAELGFDLTVEGPWDGTPLHRAAWLGDAGLVKVLLDARGAGQRARLPLRQLPNRVGGPRVHEQ